MKRKIKNYFFLSSLILTTLILSSCSISTTTGGAGDSQSNGNIFFSTDQASSWAGASNVPTVNGKVENISGVEVSGFFNDPSDNLAVYMGTKGNGLFYTYNITKGWNRVNGIPDVEIKNVAVDPKDKCTIYVAALNRLYRSDDCARTFLQVYFDNDATVTVNSVAIDFYNPRNLYIATSRGEVIKSIDRGNSWRSIWRMEEPLAKIILSPQDSRLVYIATTKNKVYSFVSNTDTNAANSEDIDGNFAVNSFEDLNIVLRDMEIGEKFVELSASSDGTIFLATANLIARSKDEGRSWESLNLLQPDGKTDITAMTVDFNSANNIYYATASTFFKSGDGGATWTTKRLPTTWTASDIMVDFKDAKNIYFGAAKPLKK
jgi:hypothetical protein